MTAGQNMENSSTKTAIGYFPQVYDEGEQWKPQSNENHELD